MSALGEGPSYWQLENGNSYHWQLLHVGSGFLLNLHVRMGVANRLESPASFRKSHWLFLAKALFETILNAEKNTIHLGKNINYHAASCHVRHTFLVFSETVKMKHSIHYE